MKLQNKITILALIMGLSTMLCACKPEESIPVAGEDVSISDEETDAPDIDIPEDEVSEVTNEETPGTDTNSEDSSYNDDSDDNDDNKNTSQNKGDDTKVTPSGDNIRGIPEVIDTRTTDDGDVLVLVNKLHAVSSDYAPTDMVSVKGDYSTNQGLELKSAAYDAYLAMRKAARKEEIYFKICSAYRSYSTQEYLFNNSLKNRGKEITYLRSAYPGRSEHHTGFAIDITSKSMGWGLSQDFINYPEGAWINEHCAEYGFIIRYPDGKTDITGYAYEPWHIRYVGVDVATEIMSQGITLEEYLETL